MASERVPPRTDYTNYLNYYRNQQSANRNIVTVKESSTPRSICTTFALFIYLVLAVFSWVIISVQSFKPITRSSYVYDDANYEAQFERNLDSTFSQNDQYYQASRVIAFILAVATIPLVVALCSGAKNAYIKRNRKTMKQAVEIVDNHEGLYLYFTVSLCLLGSLVYILQLTLVSKLTINVPNGSTFYYPYPFALMDIPSGYDGSPVQERIEDTAVMAGTLRYSLSATSYGDVLPKLWPENITCSVPQDSVCEFQKYNLPSLGDVTSGFVASLPYGYNTGLIRQFVPRLNSSTKYEVISSFPACNGDNSWSRRYTNTSDYQNYLHSFDIEICMPDTSTSFKNIRARQDIGEAMYLRMSAVNAPPTANSYDNTNFSDYTVKITVNTTAGYFELPNYMNNQQPGALLAGSPLDACGSDCVNQYYWNDYPMVNTISSGPLFRIAQALFGNNSFLDTLSKYPQSFQSTNYQAASVGTCEFLIPLTRLLVEGQVETYCERDYLDPLVIADSYILLFFNNTEWMTNALNAAAAISNEIWLNGRMLGLTYSVNSDFGTQHWRPVLTLPSLIIITILLSIFLASLVAVRVYGHGGRRTLPLNSTFMIKLGAMNHRKLGDDDPAVMVAALDEIAGWSEGDKLLVTDDVELN